jgi:hypothetical protein
MNKAMKKAIRNVKSFAFTLGLMTVIWTACIFLNPDYKYPIFFMNGVSILLGAWEIIRSINFIKDSLEEEGYKNRQ